MMKDKNIFGQSICEKEKCPAYQFEKGLGDWCDAGLEFTGRTNDLKEFGLLCKLPVGIELIRVNE